MSRLASFKLKLVLFFAVLTLLPLAIAFYGYNSLAQRSETGSADARLEAGLRAAVATYASRLDAAANAAEGLASQPTLGRSLRGRDRSTLVQLVRGVPNAGVIGNGLRVGTFPRGAATKTVSVLDGGRVLGRVIVSVPLTAHLLQSLSSGLGTHDRLIVLRAGRSDLTPGVPSRIQVGGTAYRALATTPLADPTGLELVVLTPQARISHAIRDNETTIAAALLASFLLLAGVTYTLGRSIVGSLRRVAGAANAIAHGRLDERVEVRGHDEFAQLGTAFNEMATQLQQRLVELAAERARVREVTARFGEALTATHAPEQLLQVVIESAVEATGALGGIVVSADGSTAQAGEPGMTGDRISFHLRTAANDFGTLELVGVGFDPDQIETAASLASQATVALENARLHAVVERQALVDGLTGLRNRRSVEDILHAEVARALRSDDQICLVLADLDNFKQVNDQFGHPAGDEVLRTFAGALLETVRESDVAGRWGGEEFVLVLPDTDVVGGQQLAERARSAIAERAVAADDGTPIPVTASFGVAVFPASASLEGLIAAADAALYEAKRGGKNRVVVAPDSVRS